MIDIMTEYAPFLRNPRDTDHNDPEEESNDRDDNENTPPHPENEEIVLIEQIVGEDAENIDIVHVATPNNSSRTHITGHFCWKHMA